jgi:hypothetical protein
MNPYICFTISAYMGGDNNIEGNKTKKLEATRQNLFDILYTDTSPQNSIFAVGKK